MPTFTASEAQANLYKLLDEVADRHEPIIITGKRSNAVLISEAEWRAISETFYLLNTRGMRESIIEGLNTPVNECQDEVVW